MFGTECSDFTFVQSSKHEFSISHTPISVISSIETEGEDAILYHDNVMITNESVQNVEHSLDPPTSSLCGKRRKSVEKSVNKMKKVIDES